MKTLLRWTIGDVHECGFNVLEHSVRGIKKLYDFEMVICHNSLSTVNLERVKRLGVRLVDQSYHMDSLKFPPSKASPMSWKLYPPRLSLDSHEIFMDNDIVLEKRVPELDNFLKDDSTLMSEGWDGFHGSYQHHVPRGLRINSGIIGVPPGFDFANKINEGLKVWDKEYDEQGIVAKVLLSYDKFRIIPLSVVSHVHCDWEMDHHKRNAACCGYHFIGANRESHPEFRRYSRGSLLL